MTLSATAVREGGHVRVLTFTLAGQTPLTPDDLILAQKKQHTKTFMQD